MRHFMQSTTVRHALYDHCLRGNSYAAFGWAGMGVGGEWDAVAKSLNTTFQLVGDTKEEGLGVPMQTFQM